MSGDHTYGLDDLHADYDNPSEEERQRMPIIRGTQLRGRSGGSGHSTGAAWMFMSDTPHFSSGNRGGRSSGSGRSSGGRSSGGGFTPSQLFVGTDESALIQQQQLLQQQYDTQQQLLQQNFQQQQLELQQQFQVKGQTWGKVQAQTWDEDQGQARGDADQAGGDDDGDDDDGDDDGEGDNDDVFGAGNVPEAPPNLEFFEIPEDRKIFIRPIGQRTFNEKKQTSEVIRRVWKRRYHQAWNSFKDVPDDEVTTWFNEFKKVFTWDVSENGAVFRNWRTTLRTSLRSVMSRIRNKNPRIRPRWILASQWKELNKLWDSVAYMEKRRKGKESRFSTANVDFTAANAKALGTHYGGGMPHSLWAENYKVKHGREPTVFEVYRTHHVKVDGEGNEIYVDNSQHRVAEVGNNYSKIVQEFPTVWPLDYQQNLQVENEAFINTVQMNSGRILGQGDYSQRVRQLAGRPVERISESSFVQGVQFSQVYDLGQRSTQGQQSTPTSTPSGSGSGRRCTSTSSSQSSRQARRQSSQVASPPPSTPLPPGFMDAVNSFVKSKVMGGTDSRSVEQYIAYLKNQYRLPP